MNQIQFTVRVGKASAQAEASPKENEITTISLPHENYIRSQKYSSYLIAASD